MTAAFSVVFDESGSENITLGQGDACAIGGCLDDTIYGVYAEQ